LTSSPVPGNIQHEQANPGKIMKDKPSKKPAAKKTAIRDLTVKKGANVKGGLNPQPLPPQGRRI
jgi:hypothetical protein